MGKRKLQKAIEQLATSAKRAADALDEATAYVDASNARIEDMEAEQERQRRQKAVDAARASVGLSGFDLSPKEEQRAKRYIDGEMTLGEFVGSKTP